MNKHINQQNKIKASREIMQTGIALFVLSILSGLFFGYVVDWIILLYTFFPGIFIFMLFYLWSRAVQVNESIDDKIQRLLTTVKESESESKDSTKMKIKTVKNSPDFIEITDEGSPDFVEITDE